MDIKEATVEDLVRELCSRSSVTCLVSATEENGKPLTAMSQSETDEQRRKPLRQSTYLFSAWNKSGIAPESVPLADTTLIDAEEIDINVDKRIQPSGYVMSGRNAIDDTPFIVRLPQKCAVDLKEQMNAFVKE